MGYYHNRLNGNYSTCPAGAGVRRRSIKKQTSPSELQPGVQYVTFCSDYTSATSFQMQITVHSYLVTVTLAQGK